MLLPERFMPRHEVEFASSELLRTARTQDLWDGDAPVPVELIAEALRELQLDWVAMTGDDPEATLLGALHAGQRKIYLNESQRGLFDETPGLERFTIAHELGHLELHVDRAHQRQADLGLVDTTADVLCRDGDRRPREFQAELFGATLLMPEDLIRRHVASASTRNWSTLYRLRERFAVSVTAMKNRIRDLGYELPSDPEREVRVRIWP